MFVAQVAAILGVRLWFAIILSGQSIRAMSRGVRDETVDAGDQRVAPRR